MSGANILSDVPTNETLSLMLSPGRSGFQVRALSSIPEDSLGGLHITSNRGKKTSCYLTEIMLWGVYLWYLRLRGTISIPSSLFKEAEVDLGG